MRIEWMPSRDGSLDRVTVVDRRAQYQATVRNAGLHLQPEFRLREIRGMCVKAALCAVALAAVSRRAAAELRALDWTPTHPRPDAPPSPRGSAAA